MSLLDIFAYISTHAFSIFVILATLIQISPIKIDPWGVIFKWIGKLSMKGVESKITNLDKKMQELEDRITIIDKDNKNSNADAMRWELLDFANSCRNNRKHDREEWSHTLKCLDRYHVYIKENNLVNSEIDSTDKYLREEHVQCFKDNNFL